MHRKRSECIWNATIIWMEIHVLKRETWNKNIWMKEEKNIHKNSSRPSFVSARVYSNFISLRFVFPIFFFRRFWFLVALRRCVAFASKSLFIFLGICLYSELRAYWAIIKCCECVRCSWASVRTYTPGDFDVWCMNGTNTYSHMVGHDFSSVGVWRCRRSINIHRYRFNKFTPHVHTTTTTFHD